MTENGQAGKADTSVSQTPMQLFKAVSHLCKTQCSNTERPFLWKGSFGIKDPGSKCEKSWFMATW